MVFVRKSDCARTTKQLYIFSIIKRRPNGECRNFFVKKVILNDARCACEFHESFILYQRVSDQRFGSQYICIFFMLLASQLDKQQFKDGQTCAFSEIRKSEIFLTVDVFKMGPEMIEMTYIEIFLKYSKMFNFILQLQMIILYWHQLLLMEMKCHALPY